MKNYEEIKKELIARGVRMNGFASWLFIRARSEKLGLPDARYRCGVYGYERRWNSVYPWLKSKVDIEDFSKWLLGFPQRRDVFSYFGDVFRIIGERFAELFRF